MLGNKTEGTRKIKKGGENEVVKKKGYHPYIALSCAHNKQMKLLDNTTDE